MNAVMEREPDVINSIETVQDVMVSRRWKRDGSMNRMGLTAAVLNIAHNSPEETQVRSRLMKGDVIETPLAELYVP